MKEGDSLTVSMIQQGLVDFDDPPPPPPPLICASCGHEVAAMVGCYCSWGDGP